MFAKLLFTQPIRDSPTKKINKIGSSFDHKSAKLSVGNNSRIVPYKWQTEVLLFALTYLDIIQNKFQKSFTILKSLQ
jgi:hypothetical protein